MERTFDNVKITSSFEVPETRENLVSGETIGKHFGKIAKVIGDLEDGKFGTGVSIDDTSTTDTNKTWSAKKINESIPTTLPADGGNADTVDGKHATDFAQNFSSWTTGTVKTLLLAAKSGFVFVQPNVTGMPVDGKYWFGIIHGTDSHRQLITTNISTNEIYTIVYNSALAEDKRWSAWKNVADGGDALTLNGVAASEYLQRIRHGVDVGTNPSSTDNRGLYFYGKEGTSLATGSISNAIGTDGTVITTIDARSNTTSDQARYRLDIRCNTDGSGYIVVTNVANLGRICCRNIGAGTSDLTAGTSSLTTGAIYLVYE